MKEKGVAMPGIKIRKDAVVKADSNRAESVREFKTTVIIDGSICTALAEGGRLRGSPWPFRGFWRDCKGHFCRRHVCRNTQEAHISHYNFKRIAV
jgi:hypothetical protein